MDLTWHVYPETSPPEPLKVLDFSVYFFLRMECPQKNDLAFLILVFFLSVSSSMWPSHVGTVTQWGYPVGPGLDKAQAARNCEQWWFSQGSGKCPYPEYPFPSFVVEKKKALNKIIANKLQQHMVKRKYTK